MGASAPVVDGPAGADDGGAVDAAVVDASTIDGGISVTVS